MQKTDVKYKDTIFRNYFKSNNNTIKLYNSISNSNYPDNTEIIHIEAESTVTTGFVNDLSFLIDNKIIVLVEHQSTINFNMPLRMLIYTSVVLDRYLTTTIDKDIKKILLDNSQDKDKDKDKTKFKFLINNLYKKNKIIIPNIEFYVLYNGKDKSDDKINNISIQKLSDSFISNNKENNKFLELEVKVINCNNIDKIDELKPEKEFMDYIQFVNKTEELIDFYFNEYNSILKKQNKKITPQEKQLIKIRKNELRTKAVIQSIDYCIDNNIMKEFLKKEKELIIMLFYQEMTDQDYENYIEFIESTIDNMESTIDTMESTIDNMESTIDNMESTIDKLESELEESNKKVVIGLLDILNNIEIKKRTGIDLDFIKQIREKERIHEPK